MYVETVNAFRLLYLKQLYLLINMLFLGLEERDCEKDRKEREDCSKNMDFLRCDFGGGF